jgi:SAM-dependent methyltransferase
MSVDFWNDRFAAEGYAYGREPNDFVRAEAARIPRGRVLCLAEGQGRNAVYLASLGHQVTAVDFSVEGLRKARALAAERNVEIETVQADLATYELEVDAFTGIVAIFAHLPVPVRRRVHAQVPKALKSGGAFVLEAYSPAQLAYETGGPKDVELLMTLEGLNAELAPLAFHVGREIERDIHEGPWHGGRSATVQVVAVREA